MNPPIFSFVPGKGNFYEETDGKKKTQENNPNFFGFIKEKAIIAKYKNPSHNSSLVTNLLT